MNPVLSVLKKFILNAKTLITLIALIFIWQLSPLLATQLDWPTVEFKHQLVANIGLVAAWLIYGIWQLLLLTRKLQRSIEESKLPATDLIQTLKLRFKQNIAFINRCKPRRLRGRYQRPWLLLIGPNNAGKTTLLANSYLGLSNLADQKLNSTDSTINWDWWFNDKAIFIDTPGNQGFPASNDIGMRPVWEKFLRLAMEYRPHQPLSGIILVIDIPTLCQAEDDLIASLAKQVNSLQHLKRSIPVTLVVNKIDLMAGFGEYFADLSIDERKQLLGFMLPQQKNLQDLSHQFNKQFNNLINQIGQRMMWRLHQERSLKKRGRLKDFPLQLERLKPYLEKLVGKISWSHDIQLDGIYFTSSCQQSSQLLLGSDSRPAQALTNTNPTHTESLAKSYFVHGLLTHLSHSSHNEEIYQLKKIWRRLGAYPVAALGLTAAALILHYAYQANIVRINEIQTGLKLLAANSPSTHDAWLNKLNILDSAIDGLGKKPTIKAYKWVGLDKANQLEKKTQAAYQQLLVNNFNPFLEQALISSIEYNLEHKPFYLFSSLKTYLMLIDPAHTNAQYVYDWFFRYWQLKFPDDPNYQKELLNHLRNALKHSLIRLSPNNELIAQAQSKLQQYSLSYSAFVLLADDFHYLTQPLLSSSHQLTGVDLTHSKIPLLYNLENFTPVYDTKIPAILAELTQYDWVFGKLPELPTNTEDKAKLINEIRQIYIEHYSASWKKALVNIRFMPLADFNSAQQVIANFTNPQSTFWQLVRIMLKNADTNNKYTKQGLDSDLIALTAFSAADKDFQITQSLLNNLSYYMNSIARAYNVDNAAYIAAVKHIQDLNNVNDPFNSLNELSRKLSTPVQNWIQAITQNSWGLLLNRSATYLDFLFTTTVYPEYKTHIKDGYPIFKDASANISTEDFANFFGPQGTIDTFFNYYLKPFVDISHFYWKWEKIDGQTLPISQDRLEMLLRSFLIQKMFFATQESGPAIEFELRPEGISANVSQFTLNIGGQMLQYSKINNEPAQVRWPGPDAGFITMRFDTLDGHHPTLTETGPWAWFRLLDKVTINNTNSAKQFRITFRQDEYTANYLLTAGTLINPYLPNILDKFRLEPNLIEPNDRKPN